MSQSSEPNNISIQNEQSINTLARAITYSQGEFSLILVRCNYALLRENMMDKLRQECSIDIQELELPPASETLYTAISNAIGESHPQALAVFGLETVEAIDAVLASTNQVREEFRKSFTFPLALWINDEVLRRLIKQVPDLESWASVVEFEIPPDDLMAFLRRTVDDVFSGFLEIGAAPFLNQRIRELSNNSRLSTELQLAQRSNQHSDITLDSELAASLEFLLGLTTASSMPASQQHYEQSLKLWPAKIKSERRGCICYQLGLWWRTYAVQHRAEYRASCRKAIDYYQQAIEIFEVAQRPDLVAKFINPLGETLQRLQQWQDLELLARKSFSLNSTYSDLYRQARASGFIAEALIGQSAWDEARKSAEQALQLLESAIKNEPESESVDRQDYIDWQKSFNRGWYLFALGRAQWHLGQHQEAIKTLESARAQTLPEYDPPLFIQILRTMREYYFEQKDYLKAFDIRLEYRSLEQQYGFRAFVGAGRLQAQREVLNPALVSVRSKQKNNVSQEIAASGRQAGVNRLIERIGRADQKLIVLHGQSGVGKSSIIQAGLIPSLDPITLDTREVFTVLQQVYTNWAEHLGQEMLKTLKKIGLTSLPEAVDSPQMMLAQLRQSVERNSVVVLIFDQFEEFFFVHKEPNERKPFYEFLKECLDIPYVKVVLSLREDYLHYLLECNERLVDLDVINNNILDKRILFYLGNFSRKEAQSVFQKLTKDTPYPLSPQLTKELVRDLSEELGEIRPIELQVVGSQLHTEQITTLEQYRKQGPKDELVSRFLDEVTQDCGPENEDIARLVLYLLTDENNTRPLKTREDIELEINVSEKLDLILTILVKSGLVFRIPSSPTDRYQLVHDYLVVFVRQGQSTKLIAELEKEREQRQLTEKQLNEALQKQLRTARRATLTLTGLMALVTGVAVLAFGAFANLLPLTQSDLEGKDLNDLIATLRAGQSLKRFPGVLPNVRAEILSDTNQATQDLRLLNRWDGHEEDITDIIFSPNGQFIASASEDNTVRLWNKDGSPLGTRHLEHESAVVAIDFNPNGDLIATGTENGIVSIWKIDGTLIRRLEEQHELAVTDVAFSPDGNKFASSSEDSTINVWKVSGEYQGSTRKLEIEISGINFSSDGTMIVSFADFDVVRVWDTESLKEIFNINDSYGSIHVSFNVDDRSLNIVDKFRGLRVLSFDETLITGDSINYEGELAGIEILSERRIYAAASKDPFTDEPLPMVTVRRLNTWSNSNSSFMHESGITSFAISPNGQSMVAATEEDYIYLWDITSATNISTSINRRGFPVIFDSKYQKARITNDYNSTSIFKINDNLSASGKHNIETFIPTLNEQFMGFSSSDESTILMTTQRSLELRNLPPSITPFKISDENRILNSVFNSSTLVTVTGHEDETIKVWDSGGNLKSLIKAHSDPITKLKVTQDGSKIVTL